jgi:hypothetical protein
VDGTRSKEGFNNRVSDIIELNLKVVHKLVETVCDAVFNIGKIQLCA